MKGIHSWIYEHKKELRKISIIDKSIQYVKVVNVLIPKA